MKKTVLMVAALMCTFACFAQVVDFEDLTLNPNSSWIGADGTGQFTSSYLTLYNDYSSQYGSWQGFAYTNGTDTESNSYSNLSSCVGHGASNSDYYVTAYIGTDWMGDNSQIPVAMKINTANSGNFANRGAYFCMPVLLKKWVDREYASNHFYFKLKASAYANGTLIGDSEIMMADFTEGNSYMMDDWTYVDLSWIGNADSLNFVALSNDDAGGWGINTPMYFCMDNFGASNPYPEIVDFEEFDLEPNTHGNSTERTGSFTSSYLTLYSHYDEDYGPEYAYLEGFVYTNETDVDTYSYTNYSAAVGHGNGNSSNYVNCYMGWYNTSAIKIDTEHSGDFTNRGAYFCLPTYVSKYVDDENAGFVENHKYFSVKITAYANGTALDNREVVMADFREDRTYKMDDWTFVDLSWINGADSLYFEALGDDAMTPYYFCVDGFGARNPYPEIVDFEEFELEPNTYWYSTEETGTFSSSYLTFYSHYDEEWGAPYWEGFAYTNGTDSETYSYTNNSAVAGHGNRESSNYITAYMGWYAMAGVKIDTEHAVNFTNRGAYFCLPTYVSKYVDDENAGFIENHNYFSIKITAFANGTELDNREVVMADFREDRTYKMDDWTFVDLSWINGADSLYFEALGSDPMTPYYFSMDDFGAMAPVTITATAGENGSITPSGEIEVFYGSNKEFAITPAEGYRIASVIVDAATENEANVTENIVDDVYTFVNVTADHTINATFELIPTYTITATAGEGGTISPSEVTVEEGEDAEFTITANEGYRILSVIVDAETGNESNVTSNLVEGVFTFVYVIANHTIDATFEEIPTYTITATAGENGTITPEEVTVEEGENAEFTITPAEGYRIAAVVVDAETENETDVTENVVAGDEAFFYTFRNVTANHTINATFELIPTYTITVNAGEHGTVLYNDALVSAPIEVNEGATPEFEITPETGYQIDVLTVGGDTVELTQQQLGGFTYTFDPVMANITLAVTFEAIPVPTYTITVNAGENGIVKYNDEEVIAPVVVNEGATPAFVITPAENYQIGTLTVDEEEITLTTEELAGYTYTFAAVETNHTLSVTFVPVSSADMLNAGSMSIYPNPNNGMFSIDFSNIEGDATYQLINSNGSVVETRDINVMNGETMNFNHNINAGTYFVRIISGDIVYVEQIVIE